MLRAVRYEDDSLQMPPDGKLSVAEIQVLEKWVQSGALDPRSSRQETPAKKLAWEQVDYANHWAFAKLNTKSPQPESAEVTTNRYFESQTWMDDAIQKHWLQRGITPAETADRFSLLRRLHFDLTGLPPEPHVVQQFIQDNSPLAYRKQLARLLASPEYGQRWGGIGWMWLVTATPMVPMKMSPMVTLGDIETMSSKRSMKIFLSTSSFVNKLQGIY